jgi:diketogulonate reductase-like aldo/keto reductase
MAKIALGTWAIAKGMLPIIRATRVRHVVEGQGAKELYVNLGASHVDLYDDVAGIITLRQDGTVLP